MPQFSLFRMPDGRSVRVRELGADPGSPVVHVHGIPGACIEFAHHESLLVELNVRLVSIERPGYGASDPARLASPAAWAADLEAVTDALGLGPFSLLGFSGGGVFALAGAAALQDRVDRVAVVGCPAPFTGPEFCAGMAPQNSGLWALACAGREALAQALEPMGSDPSALAEQLLATLPPADAGIFIDPVSAVTRFDALLVMQGDGLWWSRGEQAQHVVMADGAKCRTTSHDQA